MRARLFERYYRAGAIQHEKSGLGLGLYITRMLVEAHGGRVWVEGEVGNEGVRGSADPPAPVGRPRMARCAWALALTRRAQPSHAECDTLTLRRGRPKRFSFQSAEIRRSHGRRTYRLPILTAAHQAHWTIGDHRAPRVSNDVDRICELPPS